MITPGTWYVREPNGKCKRPVISAPGVKSVALVTKDADARLISAAPEMHFITRLVAALPIVEDSYRDDTPVFGVNGYYITVGDVRTAREALRKIGENT